MELDDYVHWFNHIRIHGTLGYLSRWSIKRNTSKKVSRLVLTYHSFLLYYKLCITLRVTRFVQ
ncbi:MAG: hypothetical protein C6W54_16445 [Bacillaceae bacterium]|nr:MAG: hypothetical protein C6W54_16445 [Bacillaceae bacterium]